MNQEQRAALDAVILLAGEGYANCSACAPDEPCTMHDEEYVMVTAAGEALDASQRELRVMWEKAKAAGDALAWVIYGEWTSPLCVQHKAAEEWEQITGKLYGARRRWEPGTQCGCVTQHLRDCPAVLLWHHGPAPWDSDPAKLWCYRCGSEVFTSGKTATCSGCDDGVYF